MIESPISDGKLSALGVTHEAMLERIRSAVAFASRNGIRVAFFGVDGSRADLEYFRRAYETAVEAGAAEVVVVDTLGIATPEAAAFLVGETAEWLGHDIPIHWHGHDDFGLATAAAVAAVQAGARWVHGTVNGMGERAGNADLLEVALALEALYGVPTHLRLDLARGLADLVQQRSGYALAPWKPVTGATCSPGVGCGRGAVPRPARDRAVRVAARRRGRAGWCSARRAGSTRSGSRPRSWARRAGGGARGALAAVKRRPRRSASLLTDAELGSSRSADRTRDSGDDTRVI